LATLARQARQAARYREIGEQVRRAEGMVLFTRWREADQARAEAEAVLRACLIAVAQAEVAARTAATARVAAEDALPPRREEEAIAGAVLQRLTLQRDALDDQDARARQTIATLTEAIAQLTRDAEREAGLNRDAVDTIARLEWEQAQLARAHEGHDARLATAAQAARAAAAGLSGCEAAFDERSEDVARLAARHHSTERLLLDLRATVQKAEADAGRARGEGAAAAAAEDAAAQAALAAEAALTAAIAQAAASEAALIATEQARAEVQGREAEARAARSAAEGEANALRAEVAALARLVAREAQTGTQVLDRVQVDPGYEQALGAALADDLRAPEVAGAGGSGWTGLPDYDTDQPLPAGAVALADHVRVPAVLRRRIGQIGLVARADGAALQAALRPGQRLVSREGDLWRWDGWCATAEAAPSAAALRLQQLNRLVQVKRDLEDVAARADGARLAHDQLQARLAELARADQAAREARRASDARVTELNRAASRAEADREIAGGKLEAAGLAVIRHDDDAAQAGSQLAEVEAGLAALPDLAAARQAVEALKTAVEAARAAMLARRSAHDELRREGEARVRRQQDAAKEIGGWRHRLETAAERSVDLAERRARAEDELQGAIAAPTEIAIRRDQLAAAITAATTRQARAADALAAAEGALRRAQEGQRLADGQSGEAREARARSEARRDGAAEAVRLAAERISEVADQTPAELLASLATDPAIIPGTDALEAEVARLKRLREALGAVNLRAEEDAKAVQIEHDTLAREKADLVEAIKKLRAGISGLNREGRERLLTAFEAVNASFGTLFTHLFGGGEARLVLVESDDPLEAGLEIMCQPPGKKLATLSLLSGGEQTLTALALIFAVFLANPAPICVLDEVDAPLDDANVTRFCDLLDEMTRRTETRFLVITHHAVTMARMDRLFGVTMAEQGVSQLVSVDLRKAEMLVA
ncbi:MAG: chromosome segregation protein SMC, partial [Pseudorhodobacter sp.]|nr:chromosome segregation protein SMC [Pseudorhodobacter sp.]